MCSPPSAFAAFESSGHRLEAYIFVAFLAYCLHVTLCAKLKPLAAVQMFDVHFPATDGCALILSRYTELNADQKLLVKQLKLEAWRYDVSNRHPLLCEILQRARVPRGGAV